MALSRELKVGILGGVLSSLAVLYFIQPVVTFLWNSLLFVGDTLQAGYVDTIYRSASRRSGTSGIGMLLAMVGFLVYLFLLDSNIMLGILGQIKVGTAATVVGRLRSVSNYINPTILGMLVFTYAHVILFVTVFAAVISIGIAETTVSFDQKLAILAPSVDDHQIKVWNSQWAQMKNAADYRAIETALYKRAAELNITLPKSNFK